VEDAGGSNCSMTVELNVYTITHAKRKVGYKNNVFSPLNSSGIFLYATRSCLADCVWSNFPCLENYVHIYFHTHTHNLIHIR
jgi:hypothetical protein